MILELEDRLNAKIPADHPILTWLVQHAADVVTKLEVKESGRTAYEAMRGRPYRGMLTDFGRHVLFYRPASYSTHGGQMEERWSEGTWLGKSWRQDAHLICKIEASRGTKLLEIGR